MKDVACLVFSTPIRKWDYSFTVYLIDITRQKITAFLHLNDNYPPNIGFVVYNSMLYMFGGDDWKIGVYSPDAYVLDLLHLAKSTSCIDKPSPTKLPPMNSGKFEPVVLLVGSKICVFDSSLGHEPMACHFELYDPDQMTWTKVSDPCSFSTGCLVDAHYVKDDKLFIYIRKKDAVFVLNIGDGDTTLPYWSHVDIRYNLCYDLFAEREGVIFGSSLVCLNLVYGLGHKMFFADNIGSVVWTDKTASERYDVSYGFGAKMIRLSCDRVCTIRPAVIYKPGQRMGKIQRVKMDSRRSMFLQQSLVRKWERQRKGSFRLIVNVCSVDTSSAAPDIHMEVLKSFTVPIYRDNCKLKSFTVPLNTSIDYDDDDSDDVSGYIRLASLCHLW